MSIQDLLTEPQEFSVRTSAQSPRSIPISPWESYFPRSSEDVIPDHK
jgi:hypothetical protein